MNTLLVVFINVAFILFVYITFSKKVRVLSEKPIPDSMRKEMDSLLTDFNSTTDSNIGLLNESLAVLEPMVTKAEKQIVQLEGLIKRAEALQIVKEKPLVQESLLPIDGITPKATIISNSDVANSYKQQLKEPATKKTTVKKKSRRRKTTNERIELLSKKGKTSEEIAGELGISREEVSIKMRLLGIDAGKKR